ncbi:MAG: putative DNA binding domain-containing protein, partial [Bacteroidales bacterium]|nr:putative DNA binding domain-containing protein [Bacteroidales bacterium]
MTKEELFTRINDLEWEDFEVKEAKSELPKSIWETVSAFSNTSGGWIVLGVKQVGKRFEIQGVDNAEKLEQDFLGTLRGQKFNMPLVATPKLYDIDGKKLLAFRIPSSPYKPIYFNTPQNTFIRMGSGDQHATDMEILAMQREQSFGIKSETIIPNTSFDDLDLPSLDSYRNAVRQYNPSFAYNTLQDLQFCEKVGILVNGNLTYSSLAVLGNRDSVRRHLPNFWIDYIEIPGASYRDAEVRYTYRIPEQDNIWQSYLVIYQRLRVYAENPFVEQKDGFGPDNEEQLFTLREGLINFLAHFDMFSPMHPTIRVFNNRIEMQNPGIFAIGLPSANARITSQPRNPGIIRLFRYPKLAENAGYGIDKMMLWKQLTGCDVTFETDIQSSTVTYWFKNEKKGGQK